MKDQRGWIGGIGLFDLRPHGLLFDPREYTCCPPEIGVLSAIRRYTHASRQMAEGIMIPVKGQGKLPEMALTFRPSCCLTDLLNGREQQTDQDGDDGDDDE